MGKRRGREKRGKGMEEIYVWEVGRRRKEARGGSAGRREDGKRGTGEEERWGKGRGE